MRTPAPAARIVRAPARLLAIFVIGVIRAYQVTIGRLLPDRCRFYPSCSSYAISAIKLNGPIIGAGQAVWRLLRCGPWTAGGIEEPRPRAGARAACNDHYTRQDLEGTMMGSHG